MSSDVDERPGPTRRQRRLARRRRRRRQLVFALGGLATVTVAVVASLQFTKADADGEAGAPVSSTTAATTTTSTTVPNPFDEPPFARWVREENAKTGTADWRLTRDGAAHDIEGYLDVTSAQRGETVTLYASSVAPTITVEAYRMGWYQGLGGRLVWTSPPIETHEQAGPTRIPETNTFEARWEPTATIPITEEWPDGSYLLKLVASTGQQRWVPLTVRDDSSTAAYAVVNAVTTWQAYNRWGGCSLYACPGAAGERSLMVSFDRPYDIVTDGSGDFLGNELASIMRAEEMGLDVTYLTDVDIHQRPASLLAHKAVVTLGHDEYWSKEMFDAASFARDAGVNLAFLGANAVYRQVRFEPSAVGPDRHMVNYRTTADPIRRTDPARTTVSFRDAPVNRPEAQLIGQMYQCNPVRADGVVVDAGAWVWEGTGVTDGSHIEILVGSEYDQYLHGQGGPDNVQILAHSPVTCRGRAAYADVTYYTAPSGAGVFAAGTNYWNSKLMPPDFPETAYNPVIVRATQNVLLAFGTGPAGVAHPSVPNWRELPGTGG